MGCALITGGAGFVGSHLAEALAAGGRKVVLYDNFATGTNTVAECVTGDILDLGHLVRTMRRHDVDEVVHGAAVVGVPASMERPLFATKVNIDGALTVFEACLLTGVRRVVDLSSEEVYGAFTDPEIDESAPQRPVSPYGIGKHSVELLAAHYARHYGLPYVAARLCWVYGPRFPRARLPQAWLLDALAGRDSVLASGGDQLVDLTYIDDAVDGLVRLLDAERLEHTAYHLATGIACSIQDIAEAVQRIYPEWRVSLGPGRLEHMPQKGALRIDRARAELGYEPRVDLATGLARSLQALA